MLLSGTRLRGAAEPWQLGIARWPDGQRTRSASEAFSPVVHAQNLDVLMVRTSSRYRSDFSDWVSYEKGWGFDGKLADSEGSEWL